MWHDPALTEYECWPQRAARRRRCDSRENGSKRGGNFVWSLRDQNPTQSPSFLVRHVRIYTSENGEKISFFFSREAVTMFQNFSVVQGLCLGW